MQVQLVDLVIGLVINHLFVSNAITQIIVVNRRIVIRIIRLGAERHILHRHEAVVAKDQGIALAGRMLPVIHYCFMIDKDDIKRLRISETAVPKRDISANYPGTCPCSIAYNFVGIFCACGGR